jgi:phosphocarrier protein HPr
LEKNLIISNKSGIHVRPAAQIADVANKFDSDIIIMKDNTEVNAKSIMDILTLAAGQGTKITVRATGVDEKKAIEEIEFLIMSKFFEE